MQVKNILKNFYNKRYSSVILVLKISLIIGFLTRLILIGMSWGKFENSFFSLLLSFIIGMGYDLITSLFFIFLLMIYLWLCPRKVFKASKQKFILFGFMLISIFILVFNIIGEITFWQEFNNRFDFIAVEYLIYTQEVMVNIKESYPVFWIIFIVIFIAFTIFWFSKKYLRMPISDIKFLKRTFIFSLYILTCLFSYFFISNKFRFFSKNNYINEIAGNGIFEFATAYFANEIDYPTKYATINKNMH